MKLIQIIKEQSDIESEKNELKDRLTQYIQKGCAPNGKIVSTTSDNPQYSYAIKQESTSNPGRFRYLYHIKKGEDVFEKRIAMVNSEGRLEFTSKWFCDIELKNTEKTEFTRQEKTPQQVNAIKTYTDSGWEDKGRMLNPTELSLYDTIDMKDIYNESFPESYILVKKIESIDTNTLLDELTELVNTKNFGNRRTCKQIISKYNVAKQKNAPVNDAVLRNFKTAVNSCRAKIENFYDLGRTQKTIETLVSDTENQRWSLGGESTSGTTPSVNTTETP
jgi:hypothetical protein